MTAAAESFSGHRGIAPMLSVLAALAVIEMLVVHLFVSLKWPSVAWLLTIVSTASIIWLVRFITSFKRCPHTIDADHLRLRMGSLRTIDVPLMQVAQVRRQWESGAETNRDTANLVPIAYPNRLIDIHPPINGRRGPLRAIAIRLDEPAAFDAALSSRGILLV
ncbi:MAG: hypothetical protein LH466_03370 [Sphingomonas bacterium]|nr:hypothetical protein [Sphingomonas bacterium]